MKMTWFIPLSHPFCNNSIIQPINGLFDNHRHEWPINSQASKWPRTRSRMCLVRLIPSIPTASGQITLSYPTLPPIPSLLYNYRYRYHTIHTIEPCPKLSLPFIYPWLLNVFAVVNPTHPHLSTFLPFSDHTTVLMSFLPLCFANTKRWQQPTQTTMMIKGDNSRAKESRNRSFFYF